MKIPLKKIKEEIKAKLNNENQAFHIISKATNLTKTEYLIDTDKEIDVETYNKINEMAEDLQKDIPLAYILGNQDFCGYEFAVGPGVLIPRVETEELVYKVLDYVEKNSISNIKILELCGGSGCIGISLAKKIKNSSVVIIEKDGIAFEFLNRNLHNLKAENVSVFLDDVLSCYDKFPDYEFDIIISNPPYIKTEVLENLDKSVKFEPSMALDGGKDGLLFYKNFSVHWLSKLKEDGVMFLEIDDENVKDLFDNIQIEKDYFGNTRFAIVKRR
ncbi:MAG: peptide chain release factor N(5)-glutamine methyltransferase [Clostridia bacterium]|nr:peptide chain release factor N(5)-glutamine methyltransferase [Clostridia bacterium]